MKTDYGTELKIESIKVGDTVQWAQAGGTDIEVQGKSYTFVPYSAIVLIEQ
jgi:co-chaperonin GroES (HSP10)